jgi:hypothetical protein
MNALHLGNAYVVYKTQWIKCSWLCKEKCWSWIWQPLIGDTTFIKQSKTCTREKTR